MKKKLLTMKVRELWMIPVAVFMTLVLTSASANAAVGGMTIGGCIYEGNGHATYATVGPEIESTWTTHYAADGSGLTPPITGAQVLIQNQHSGGKFVAYGTMGFGTGGNCWETTIPDTVTPGTPDVTDLIATVAAPGYAITSREWTWNADGRFSPENVGNPPTTWGAGTTMNQFIHPTGVHPGAGADCTTVPGECTSVWLDGSQDAYLMTYPQKTTSALHYVFYDNLTDGNDNGNQVDPGLNGVTVRMINEHGTVVATQVTGALAFSQGGIVTDDGAIYLGELAYGYVYFRGLPGNDEYKIEVDPSTVTQADNPHFTLNMADDPGADCTTGVHVDYQLSSCKWYQTYTEEGTHAGELYAWPGSPGTEGGAYLTWHGLVEKMPSDINPTGAYGDPALNGTITGTLMDSTGNEAAEPVLTIIGGRVPPTNARSENDVAWNITRSASGWGGTADPSFPASDVIPNSRVWDGIVILFENSTDFPKAIATTFTTNGDDFNDPSSGGEFQFTNVPPGNYGIFAMDKNLYYVMSTGTNVAMAPNGAVDVGPLYERWGARSMGFVERNASATPAAGISVKKWYKGGRVKGEETSNADGWFLERMWWETGQMGHQYVDIPDGADYRGKIVTEQFQDVPTMVEPPGIEYHWVTHNAMNRGVGYATHNYFVDLQIEDIPAGVGNLIGNVYNDHFSSSTSMGNGVRNEDEDRLWEGWNVELYNTDLIGTCTTLDGGLVDTRKTGQYSKGAAGVLGWNQPYTYPADEVGTSSFGIPYLLYTGGGNPMPPGIPAVAPVDFVERSPLLPNIGTSPSETLTLVTGPDYAPMPGFYEWRDMTPGDYCVRVIPENGFARSDIAADPVTGLVLVTVTGGLNSRVDLGVNTTPPGSTWGIRMAGEMEGGLWDGEDALDLNPTSLLFMDAIALFGGPISAKDGNDYFLGVGFQGDTRCHSYNNALHTPGASMLDPLDPAYDAWSCRSTIALSQKPEFERRFAAGANRYTGNDAGFPWNRFDPSIPGTWTNYESMELGYGVSQADYKFEAAWTPLLKTGGPGTTEFICATALDGTSYVSAPWGATVTVTSSKAAPGGTIPIVNARVLGYWTNDAMMECEGTDANGECVFDLPEVTEEFLALGIPNITFTVATILPHETEPWLVYNANAGGPLNGACKTSVDVYDPDWTGYIPPPPVYECMDAIDNDLDSDIDYPADLGCVTAEDDNEDDTAPPTPAPECSNGLDDDGDTFIDWPNDPGCVDAADDDEYDAPPVLVHCMDGIDNDGDGLVDMDDPSCTLITDTTESPVQFFASINGKGYVNGITSMVRDEDIIFFDGVSFSMFFDGSAYGLGSGDINALHVVDEDTFYVSFNRNTGTTIPAGTTSPAFTAQDEDVVLYDAGNWSLYFDGSAYGLGDYGGEDVDALSFTPYGHMVISTVGSANSANATKNPIPLVISTTVGWTGLNPRPQDEDLLVFDGVGFDMYFDASDPTVQLNNTNVEDVYGAAVTINGDIFLTTNSTFTTGLGLSGGGNDVFACRGVSTGRGTSCISDDFVFQGTGYGVENNKQETLDAFSVPGAFYVVP